MTHPGGKSTGSGTPRAEGEWCRAWHRECHSPTLPELWGPGCPAVGTASLALLAGCQQLLVPAFPVLLRRALPPVGSVG